MIEYITCTFVEIKIFIINLISDLIGSPFSAFLLYFQKIFRIAGLSQKYFLIILQYYYRYHCEIYLKLTTLRIFTDVSIRYYV